MEEEKTDAKLSEKFSLKFRKTIIVSKMFTLIIVLALIAAFIGINILIKKVDLPEIDVTANKLYTLSEASKKAVAGINQDIKIYVFGIDENDAIVKLVKQYCDANEKISYEMLSKESNLGKVQEFELEDGYRIIVIQSGESKKIIDASAEFSTYDYETNSQIDTTEQSLTNSLLNISNEKKPKVYFVEGHEEFKIAKEEGEQAELGVLSTYLKNEAFDINTLNLTISGNVPEDCSVLAIMSPKTDFLENEAQSVIDYINKGGNIFFTRDVLEQGTKLENIQKILDLYGVSVENGYIIESDSDKVVANYPYLFRPEISSSNDITSDIASDSYIWIPYALKLNFLSSEQMEGIKATYEELLGTSDSAFFINDLSSDVKKAASTAEKGHCTIAALVTKTISEGTTDENSEEKKDEVKSKLIISGNGKFMADYVVSELSSQYPISYLGSNKDFAINSISSLSDKDNGLKIRKEMAGTSYLFTATEKQNYIVLAIIFIIPIVIIIIGIIIGHRRKKRK